MELLIPNQYRLKAAQDAYLKALANKQGHGNKALMLRIVLDRVMQQDAELNGRKTSKR